MDEDSKWQRKWVTFFIVTVLFTFSYVATIKWEAARAEYATYGGLMLALYSIYVTGNIGNKWAVRKGQGFSVGGDIPDATVDEPPPPKPPKK